MHRPIRTAVAVSASPEMMHAIALFLAENGIELLSTAHNGIEALECLKDDRADLLIADTPLPVLDGVALVERALATFCLPVRPRAMLMCHPPFAALCRDKIEPLGAVLLEKPLDRASFERTVAHLADCTPVYPEAETRFMENLLSDLGFPTHPGQELLKYAALISAHGECFPDNSSSAVVSMAAELCACTSAQAERAMRYAIAKAWQSDKFENQYRIFSDTVDAGRGQPTLSEMISRLADILRLEG